MTPLYTATAFATGREGRAVTTDGALDVRLAAPKELGGSGEGTNPEQLFAAGYAACFASALGLVARRLKVELEPQVTAEVQLSSIGGGRFGLAVKIAVIVPDELDEAVAQQLVDVTHQVCPYSNATRGNIPVEVVIERP
jgi:osmotically inducible protein OsmC